MANRININRSTLAGYRVVARHRDGRESLVTLAENARQAAFLAKAFSEALEASGRRDGIVSVRTEEWVGFLDHGVWRPISSWNGVFWHRFATRASREKSKATASS